MKKLTFLSIMALLFLFLPYIPFFFFEVNAQSDYPVHNLDSGKNYATIQEAINDPETLNGHTIFVEEGIYREHIVVNKAVKLVGENRNLTIIDGNRTGIVIKVVANNVVIKEFTVRNGTSGIYLQNSNNSIIINNNVIFNVDAVLVRYSRNCTIHQNFVSSNNNRGILVTNSWNFTVSSNHVYNSGWYGLNANSSLNGLITQNNVVQNYFDGIGLFNSSMCKVTGNNVTKNTLFGVTVDSLSENNLIYHNNIISNGIQATNYLLTNQWDNGVEGNYWSNYFGNDSDRNGIGDTQYNVNEDTADHYPLMGMFYSFDAPLGLPIAVISNSTLTNFQYLAFNSTIKIQVTNKSQTQQFGFCRIAIPKNLIAPPYTILIDNGATQILYLNETVHENATYNWLYFAYPHSTHDIVIAPEFSSLIILSTLMICALFASIINKRKQRMRKL